MTMRKAPIGIDSFDKIIRKDRLLIDKSLFIQDVLEDSSEVLLITRPRRFGKSLNLSMLRCFLDCELGQERAQWFKDLAISKAPPSTLESMGQFPVLMLSLKSAEHTSLEPAIDYLTTTLKDWVLDRSYLLKSEKLNSFEIEWLERLARGELSRVESQRSLATLTRYIKKHWEQEVVLLIDEYDAPVHSAYQHGYYEDMITFMRGWLGEALKSNPNLERGVLTGVLRISKESIFSGLNNVSVYGVHDTRFSSSFGFSQREVDQLLEQQGLTEQREHVRFWYNGYLMGQEQVYNPWSILHFIDSQGHFKTYWTNSSDNQLVNRLLANAGPDIKSDFEALIQGETILRDIDERVHLGQLDSDKDALWALLLASGYLTSPPNPSETQYPLRIPNHEVHELFVRLFKRWWTFHLGSVAFQQLLKALTTGQAETLEASLATLSKQTLSFFDTSGQQPERVYHAFVLGMAAALSDQYQVKSNRESGFGRYDVMLIPRQQQARGVIIEFKLAAKDESLKKAADRALAQIQAQAYTEELEQAGHPNPILWGIAFRGKAVGVSVLL